MAKEQAAGREECRMERPYVICHILSSLDGKIAGPFMGTETVRLDGSRERSATGEEHRLM